MLSRSGKETQETWVDGGVPILQPNKYLVDTVIHKQGVGHRRRDISERRSKGCLS